MKYTNYQPMAVNIAKLLHVHNYCERFACRRGKERDRERQRERKRERERERERDRQTDRQTEGILKREMREDRKHEN